MEQLLQALVLGLLIGGVYALMASGLTLVFGVMNIVNVAHGATLIGVAMVTWWVWNLTGLDPLLVGVLLVPVMFGVGWLPSRASSRGSTGRGCGCRCSSPSASPSPGKVCPAWWRATDAVRPHRDTSRSPSSSGA